MFEQPKRLYSILFRGETKASGKGFWRKDHCMVGQNKEFKWLITNFKNPVEHATDNAK